MIDWLGSRTGRLAAFFLLYVTEGIPLGYTATFVATLMRREGVSTAVIGAFVASLYLPWSFKWAAGPFVDLFRSRRLGPRRAWIAGTQLAMTLALSSLGFRNLLGGIDVTDVALFTAVIVVSNIFGAIQDVAIDALAVDSLHESERGLANGLMFAGAGVGQALGGSGALYLVKWLGFAGATFYVVGCLLLVLVGVSIALRERAGAEAVTQESVGDRLSEYLSSAKRAFFGSSLGRLGLVIALLPAGGHALGLALQTNLAVELRFSDDAIALLNLISTLAFSVFCAGGGWLSDRLGRLRSLSAFIALTALPTLALAWMLWQAGWIMPIDPKAAFKPTPPATLLAGFWTATILFNLANGLMYGTRSAFFMDFCDPKIAATQFTAYMALMNLVTSYTSFWQGYTIERFGYPVTLVLDATYGLVCLPLLAVAARLPKPEHPTASDDAGAAPINGRCPTCGGEVSPDARECLRCGEKLRIIR